MLLKVVVFSVALQAISTFALPTNNWNNWNNAEELEGAFQGDMIITEDELNIFNGRIDKNLRWPNNTVPYFIDSTFFNEEQIGYIHKAAKTISDIGCVQFVNRTNQVDFITVSGNATGCSSNVGRVGGSQVLKLAPNKLESGCFRLFTIVHEFIHALGFHHMQSSHDRDAFVKIVWNNIKPDNVNNFLLYGADRVTHFDVPYDLGSVMHYSANAFSVNGQSTIVPVNDLGDIVMGQREKMTDKDILRIRRMYGCTLTPHHSASE